jgi:hypothetical protein
VPIDAFSLRSCVTTVADAGSPGWRNFDDYKARIIDKSKQFRDGLGYVSPVLLPLILCRAASDGGSECETAQPCISVPTDLIAIASAVGPNRQRSDQCVALARKAALRRGWQGSA